MGQLKGTGDGVAALCGLSRELVDLGRGGGPVYADRLSRLWREVYVRALALLDARGGTVEEEARLCLSLLSALSATPYDNGRKRVYIDGLLERSRRVLPLLPGTRLKARLLLCCYGETYEESLLREAQAVASLAGKGRPADGVEELARAEEALLLPGAGG